MMFNTNCSATTALADAQQLINSHVLAVIDGDAATDPTWVGQLEAAKIPVICGTAVDDETCQSSPDLFPSGGTTLVQIYGALTAAKGSGAKTVSAVYCVESPQCKAIVQLIGSYAHPLGLRPVDSLAASLSAVSYSAQCLTLKQAGAQAVLPAGPPVGKFADDCASQGYKPIFIQDATWVNSELTDPNLSNASGSNPDIPWTVSNSPATKAFHSALGSFISHSYSPYSLSATWAAGLLFEAAAAHLGRTPTAAGLTAGLYDLKDNTLGGFAPPLTFTRGKPHIVPYFFTLKIRDAKFVATNNASPRREPGVQAS
jgi:branched-chain amino acid transport system substrate-binding protein